MWHCQIRKKYGDLVEFEARLANTELPEHPYWEESIEYRNAYEELENLKRRQQRKTSSTWDRWWWLSGYTGNACGDRITYATWPGMRGMLSIKTTSDTHADTNANCNGNTHNNAGATMLRSRIFLLRKPGKFTKNTSFFLLFPQLLHHWSLSLIFFIISASVWATIPLLIPS